MRRRYRLLIVDSIGEDEGGKVGNSDSERDEAMIQAIAWTSSKGACALNLGQTGKERRSSPTVININCKGNHHRAHAPRPMTATLSLLQNVMCCVL